MFRFATWWMLANLWLARGEGGPSEHPARAKPQRRSRLAASLDETASNMTVHEAITHQGEAKEPVQKTESVWELFSTAFMKMTSGGATDNSWWTKLTNKVSQYLVVSTAAGNLLKLVLALDQDQVKRVMEGVTHLGLKAATRFNQIFETQEGKQKVEAALQNMNDLLSRQTPEEQQDTEVKGSFLKTLQDKLSAALTLSKSAVNFFKLLTMMAQHGKVKEVMDEVIDFAVQAATVFNLFFESDAGRNKLEKMMSLVNEVLKDDAPDVP